MVGLEPPTQPNQLTVPRLGRARLLLGRWILIARSTFALSRAASIYPQPHDQNRTAAASSSSSSSRDAIARVSAMGRASRGGAQRPVASSTSPTGGCIKCAPVHRPRASSSQLLPSLSVLPWQGEHPRLVAIASSPPLLLKHRASSLVFFYAPTSPSQHPRFVWELKSPSSPSPPLPHLGSLAAVSRISGGF